MKIFLSARIKKGTKQTKLPVIKDLSLTVHQEKWLPLWVLPAQEESLLAHGVMGILPIMQKWAGTPLLWRPLTEKRIRALRGKKIVIVPQSTSYLDPLMKVGTQICKGKDH